MPPKHIYLHLSIDEVNLILEALGNMPYAKVYDLIDTIRTQANEQIQHGQSEVENTNTQEVEK